MLSLSRSRTLHSPGVILRQSRRARHGALTLRPRRTFVTSPLQTLSESFLDLAIALPLPPNLPPYSTTIILLTVLSRVVFTLPFSIWAKKRQWKAESVVLPALQEGRPMVLDAVRSEMAKSNVTGTKEQLQMAYSKRVEYLMKKYRDALFKAQGWSPRSMFIVPLVTQVPVFVGLTMVVSRACQAPTPLDAESFTTLTSLAHVDPTAALPIALGIITLANVESSRWFMSAEQRERERKVDEWTTAKRAKGETVFRPRNILQGGLRLLSIGRIMVAATFPGGVVISWVTSATFGLLQTWAFDWWERRRVLSNNLPPIPSTPPIPPTRQPKTVAPLAPLYPHSVPMKAKSSKKKLSK